MFTSVSVCKINICLLVLLLCYYYHATTADPSIGDTTFDLKRRPRYVLEPRDDSSQLPPIAIISAYVGSVSYEFIRLTLTSMKFNPEIDFMIVNVVDKEEAHNYRSRHSSPALVNASTGTSIHTKPRVNRFHRELSQIGLPRNIHLKVISFEHFSSLIEKKLQITVPFNITWYYKMCDYKPTFAYLFNDMLEKGSSFHKKPFNFWGYADLDLIWGRFKRFAHLFQGQYDVIRSGAVDCCSSAVMSC